MGLMTHERNLDSPVDDSAETPTRRATYQDVLDAPAHQVAEIVDGTLHLSPRPVPLQALASGTLHRMPAPFRKCSSMAGLKMSSSSMASSSSPH